MMTVLLLCLACADPTKGKSTATVTEPPKATETKKAEAPVTPPPAAPAAPGVKLSGKLGFVGAKVTKEHPGEFSQWSGEASLKGGALESVKFEVQVASLSTGIEKLDNHLKSPDFFDVEKNPTASFVSTAITAGAPADSKLAGATHSIEGDLSMHGVTKRIRFPAVIEVNGAAVKARTEFGINRQDFGISYPGKPDDLIKDEVLLQIDVSG